jgi:hypothetical protein
VIVILLLRCATIGGWQSEEDSITVEREEDAQPKLEVYKLLGNPLANQAI